MNQPPTGHSAAEYMEQVKTLEAKVEGLKEGIRLYIILRNRAQFTSPDVIEEISKLTGKEYKPGHLISHIEDDLEQALKEK